MSWKSQKAIKRIYNTFKRLNKQIFQEDIDALKSINDILDEMTQVRIKDNVLFAKLLCSNMMYNNILTNDIQQSIRLVQDDLDKPLTTHLEMLKIQLNNSELINFMKSKGIEFNNNQKDNEIIKQYEKDFSNKILNEWDFKLVEKSFLKTANEMISNIENYTM